jgi:hypothetical protein
MKFTNWLPTNNLNHPDWVYMNPLTSGNVSFFDKFDASTIWEDDILKIKKEYDDDCV